MTTDRAIRDAVAKREAMRQYAIAHDRFANLEQAFLARGCPLSAEGVHIHALITLRAWLAEKDDPEPEGPRR